MSKDRYTHEKDAYTEKNATYAKKEHHAKTASNGKKNTCDKKTKKTYMMKESDAWKR